MDKADIINRKQGYLLFDYKNKTYFIETSTGNEFGMNAFKIAFVITNFCDSAVAMYTYNNSKEVELFEPGSVDNNITVKVCPVEIEYYFDKTISTNDETLVMTNGKIIVFRYQYLKDLKLVDLEKI